MDDTYIYEYSLIQVTEISLIYIYISIYSVKPVICNHPFCEVKSHLQGWLHMTGLNVADVPKKQTAALTSKGNCVRKCQENANC